MGKTGLIIKEHLMAKILETKFWGEKGTLPFSSQFPTQLIREKLLLTLLRGLDELLLCFLSSSILVFTGRTTDYLVESVIHRHMFY